MKWAQDGNDQEGLDLVRRAVEIDASNYRAWFKKGMVEQLLGQTDEGRRSLRRFLELAPPDDAEAIGAARRALRETEQRRGE